MTAFALAIEVSNPAAAVDGGGPSVAVAAIEGDEIVGSIEVERLRETGRHDDDLMPAMERVCARGGAAPGDIAKVVVSTGPGGFTGLRVAVATAKALALSIGAVVVGVPTAAVAARRVEGDSSPALVLLNSKRVGGEVTAWGVVVGGGVVIETLGLVGPEQVEVIRDQHGVRSFVADPKLPDGFVDACGALGLDRRGLIVDAGACLEAGVGLAGVDVDALVPLYGREPEAVRKWRELHGSAPGDA